MNIINSCLSYVLPVLELLGVIDKNQAVATPWNYIIYGTAIFLCVGLPIGNHFRSLKRLRIISARLHDISNDIRNHYTKLHNAEDTDIKLVECGKSVVDRLKEVLDCLTGKKTRVSIRIVDNKVLGPQDSKKTRCTTICWDKEKKSARPDDEKPSLISQYTALKEIGQKNNAYYSKNWISLGTLLNKTPYIGGYSTWKNDYKSVLVVPIRIKTVYLPKDCRGDGEYAIMGFIWCDWDSVYALPLLKKNREIYTNLLHCVADTFFHYLFRTSKIQPQKRARN